MSIRKEKNDSANFKLGLDIFPFWHWRWMQNLLSGCYDIQHNDTQYNDIQHNDTQHEGLIWDTQDKWLSAWMALSILFIECNYAECFNLFYVMLNVVMLNVVMLNIVMLNVVMLNVVKLNVVMLSVVILSVVAPLSDCHQLYKTFWSVIYYEAYFWLDL